MAKGPDLPPKEARPSPKTLETIQKLKRSAERNEPNAKPALDKFTAKHNITVEQVDHLLPPETFTGDQREFLLDTQRALEELPKPEMARRAGEMLASVINKASKDMTAEQFARRLALTVAMAAYGETSGA